MPELLDEIRRELDNRLGELRPIVEEYERLQRASDALAPVATSGAGAATGTRAAAPSPPAAAKPRPRPRKAAGAKATPRKAAAKPRPSGADRAPPGQTQARVIEELRAGPGSSSTAIAKIVGISANAAAATISRLVKQGRVRRLEEGGYAVAEAPGTSDTGAGADGAAATSVTAGAGTKST